MTDGDKPGAAGDGGRAGDTVISDDYRSGRRAQEKLIAVPGYDLDWPHVDDIRGRKDLRDYWLLTATRGCAKHWKAVCLLPSLWLNCNLAKPTPKTWPSNEMLCRNAAVSESSVTRGLKIMETLGFIRQPTHKRHRKGKIGTDRDIYLTLPAPDSSTPDDLRKYSESATVDDSLENRDSSTLDDTFDCESSDVDDCESSTVDCRESSDVDELSLESSLEDDPLKLGTDALSLGVYGDGHARGGLERLVVGYILHHPESFPRAHRHLAPDVFTHPRLARVWAAMANVAAKGRKPSRHQVRVVIDPEDRKDDTALEVFLGVLIHEHRNADAEEFEEAVETLADELDAAPSPIPAADNAYARASRGY